jgi:hypothetical protein
MTPTPPPSPDTDDDDDATISVADRAAGRTRLLSAQCRTCVFRPGNPMSISPGRLHDLVDQARTRGTFIICHETLPYADPPPGVQPAICRGFRDRCPIRAKVAPSGLRLHMILHCSGLPCASPARSTSSAPVTRLPASTASSPASTA